MPSLKTQNKNNLKKEKNHNVNVLTFEVTHAFSTYLIFSHIFTHSICPAVCDCGLKIPCLFLSSGRPRPVYHSVTSILL